jgi:hypothetical protein
METSRGAPPGTSSSTASIANPEPNEPWSDNNVPLRIAMTRLLGAGLHQGRSKRDKQMSEKVGDIFERTPSRIGLFAHTTVTLPSSVGGPLQAVLMLKKFYHTRKEKRINLKP